MIRNNYHTHTVFCDGSDTAEDIVKTAINMGCTEIGFTGHSYTDIPDEDPFCMTLENTDLYIKEISRLKREYEGKIKILLGVEQDYYSTQKTDTYEYVIGSVHYVLKDGVYISIDYSKQVLIDAVNRFYNGDFYALAEDYYNLVGDIYNKTKCDIVGHFDIITKFNENKDLFDVNNKRYVDAYTKALNKLMGKGLCFEVNFGAVARNYRTTPYPQKEILNKIIENKEKIIYSSDCHNKENLLFGINGDNIYIK